MIEIFDTTDKFPLQKIGKFAGVCWNSPVDDAAKNIARAKDCIKSGHGRVLEFVDIELCISGYSARAIREYYTHIGGGPTRLQESTRYVNCEEFDYFVPPSVKDSSKCRSICDGSAESIYRECMDMIRQKYAELLDAGVSKEDAANVLPLGMMTKIVDKRNLRNMINLMNQRLCSLKSARSQLKSARRFPHTRRNGRGFAGTFSSRNAMSRVSAPSGNRAGDAHGLTIKKKREPEKMVPAFFDRRNLPFLTRFGILFLF